MVLLLLSLLCSLIPELCAFTQLNVVRPSFSTLFLCHFTHWDFAHLFWDGISFFVLALLYERGTFLSKTQVRKRSINLLFHCFASALFISLITIKLPCSFLYYRGLSGLCCTLFGLLLIDCYRTAKAEKDLYLTLGVFIGVLAFISKTTYELCSGTTLFVSSDAFQVATLAHGAGALWAIGSYRVDLIDFFRDVFPKGASVQKI